MHVAWKLALGSAVTALHMVAAPSLPSASAQSASKQCIQDCKLQQRACAAGQRAAFKTANTGCESDGAGDVRTCKKAVKQTYKQNKRQCKQLSLNLCRPCCDQGNGTCTVTFVGGQQPAGATTTSDFEGDGTTATDPVELTVRSTGTGNVTIVKAPLPFGIVPPAGFDLLAVRLMMTAPAATPDAPLALTFEIDATRVPPSLAAVGIFLDRSSVPQCAGGAGLAAPDPCIVDRTIVAGGDARVTVLASRGESWNVGILRCGNGTIDTGESCDGGACCLADCSLVPANTLCRPSGGICDRLEACDGVHSECPPDGFRPAAVECRRSSGECDVTEHCTGRSPTCPADAKSTNICRAAQTSCDAVERCDGVNDECPPNGHASATTVCRPAAGACDLPETCTGLSSSCPADFKSVAMCRPAVDVCDVSETCDGQTNNCPPDGFAPVTQDCRPSAGICDRAETCAGDRPTCPMDAKSAAVCRPAADLCDAAEICDGTGNDCPPDILLPPLQTCRPVAGACDVPEMCNGVSMACPSDIKRTDVCRPAAGDCDVAESCNGTSANCPPDTFAPTTQVCRPAVGPCDFTETCSGVAPNCLTDFKSQAECRPAVDLCDVAERCNGLSDFCPPDVVASAGVTCRPAGGMCDVAEQCSGLSNTCPTDAKRTNVCRPSAGMCDVAESCNGVSNTCPNDAFALHDQVCRPAAGLCDLPEMCPGNSPLCLTDFKKIGETCRLTAGVCDVAESCSGTSNDCPPDVLRSTETVCRPAVDLCDAADVCTGTGAACPADAKSTGVCRSAGGPCDAPEICDGASNQCPPNAFEPPTTVCRPPAGVCDAPDRCTGTTAACPLDVKSTAVCRVANGVCDVAESCDGLTNNCPADGLAQGGTECRAAAGVCDIAEQCTGFGTTCGIDRKRSPSVCRAAVDLCDMAESCDGFTNDCPADGVRAAQQLCRAAAGICDRPENCNGSSVVCPPDLKSPFVCRLPASPCDAVEFCNGTTNDCPVDRFANGGTPCNDGQMCTEDLCDGLGNCIGSAVCGDGDVDPTCAEECDEGAGNSNAPNASCRPNCTARRCGDGIVDDQFGEACETSADCDPGESCGAPASCTCGAEALGSRTFSVDAGAIVTAPPGDAAQGEVFGALTLVAGAPDAGGMATVVKAPGAAFLFADMTDAGERLCRRITSCSGSLHCDGGINVDVTVELDSLQDAFTCDPDTAPGCQSGQCCLNACEGGASGNAPATTVGVNPGVDSGPGALTLACHEATAVVALGADCSTAAYGPDAEAVYTTGTATAMVMNECRNPAGAATISLTGEPFDCADWTAEDGPGKLAVVEPLEEPAGSGDAAMGGIIGDAP